MGGCEQLQAGASVSWWTLLLPLVYMCVQQLAFYSPLAVLFFGAYVPMHVRRRIREEVSSAPPPLA